MTIPTRDRLAFTTLGIPGAPLQEVVALARRSGWTGLELRSAPDEPVHTGLDVEARRRARAELEGVVLLALNSYVRCGDRARSDGEIVAAALAEARLASDLGARAVRVFPGAGEDPSPRAEHRMVARLRSIAEELPEAVDIWLETHDSHRTGESVSRVLDAVGHPRVRAIWDVAHPPKDGEAWPRTLDLLGPHLAHVQVKDERPGEVPLFLGEGEVPVAEVVRGLEASGYHGWYSLEYELKWHPEAPPLEEALTRGTAWWADQGL